MEQYAHLLIATPRDFVPTPQELQGFATSMLRIGAIPTPFEIDLRTVSDRTRQGVNPFTGKLEVFPLTDIAKLSGQDVIANSVAGLMDFELAVSGEGMVRVPPVPIDFHEAYSVVMTCVISSTLRSTSDNRDDGAATRYGEPCGPEVRVGRFSDPSTGRSIEVPGAGCARFWIEFELGKFLFPNTDGDVVLEIINPTILEEANRTFKCDFLQGRHIFD